MGLLVYAAAAYASFLAVFLYLVGFLWNTGVPKGIDTGEPGPIVPALLVNLVLLALFGLQHSVMARPAFKRAWTAIVPEPAERATYVLVSSLALALLMADWQPVPRVVWDTGLGRLSAALHALSALGWLFTAASTFAIDHLHLFGLRQPLHAWLGRPRSGPEFRVRGPYHLVRHPLMLGFLVAFWSTPRMSLGHLEFALAMTLYIHLALAHEERDLRAAFGPLYDSYAARTPRLNPFARR